MSDRKGPKILVLDIETAFMTVEVWDTGEQYVPAENIVEDWCVLSWSAKWLQNPDGSVNGPHNKMMYMDQRKARNVRDDRRIMKGLFSLLEQADVIITKNGKKFDEKRFNARFLELGLGRPSSYRHTDVEKIVRKHFYFPSYSLEYLSKKLCKKYRKLKHSKFPGKALWRECINNNNQEAWKEMEVYNEHDVLATEELYQVVRIWDNSINFSVYYDKRSGVCSCGSTEFVENGHSYTSVGKFKRYKCRHCGNEMPKVKNEISARKPVKKK